MPEYQSADQSSNWMREIRSQARKGHEENGILRSLFKRAKSDGENITAMRAALRAVRLDPEEAIKNVSDQLRYMHLLRMPITREALFDWDQMPDPTVKTRSEEDIWEIEEAGYRSGRHGGNLNNDNPHPPGSEYHVHWAEWWHKGQAAIARELGPNASLMPASLERPKRGAQTRMAGTEEKQDTPERAARKKAAPRKRSMTRKRRAGNGTRAENRPSVN